MATEYATNLEVLDASSDAPAALADVVRVVAEWAEMPIDEPADFDGFGRGGGRVVAAVLEADDPDAWGWRLTIDVAAPDRGGDVVNWLATVVAVESAQTLVAIRIERIEHNVVLRPASERPRPPRIVGALIDAPELKVVDGMLPVRAVPTVLGSDRVDAFVQSLLEPGARRLPIIGVSEARGTCTVALDVRRLASDLAGIAHVVTVPEDVSPELSVRMSHRLGVYNGAIRLWWPRLELTDHPRAHPFWMRSQADRAQVELVELVAGVAASRLGEPPIVSQLETRVRTRAAAVARAELEELLERVTAPEAVASDRSTAAESIRGRLRTVEADRDDALELAAQVEQEYDELKRELARYRGEVYHLRAALAGREDASPATEVEAFVQQIRDSYYLRFSQGDRLTYPLRRFTLGADFLGMLQQVDVPRQKVIDVCAEIACGFASQINGRKVHQLRESVNGDAPPRKRRSDGAVAWRCALDQGELAARLHWWEADGSVEFASVGPHDFMDVPE